MQGILESTEAALKVQDAQINIRWNGTIEYKVKIFKDIFQEDTFQIQANRKMQLYVHTISGIAYL